MKGLARSNTFTLPQSLDENRRYETLFRNVFSAVRREMFIDGIFDFYPAHLWP